MYEATNDSALKYKKRKNLQKIYFKSNKKLKQNNLLQNKILYERNLIICNKRAKFDKKKFYFY